VNGTGSFGILDPIAESWETNAGTTFNFSERLGPGRFKYRMSGSVTYRDAGSGNGCNHVGAGTDFGRKSLTFSYLITNSCDEDHPDKGPGNPLFLNTGIGVTPQPLPFGSELLSGTYAPNDDSNIFWIFR
jgi:hypothetical protein